MVDTTGLDKAAVLAALYNAAKPLGMGFLHYTPEAMSSKEAAEFLAQGKYFDYLNGRVMKVDLSKDNGFEEWLYDRDNGSGKAAAVINELRNGEPNSKLIRSIHESGVDSAAQQAEKFSHTHTTRRTEDGVNVVTLGADGLGDELREAVRRAKSNSGHEGVK